MGSKDAPDLLLVLVVQALEELVQRGHLLLYPLLQLRVPQAQVLNDGLYDHVVLQGVSRWRSRVSVAVKQAGTWASHGNRSSVPSPAYLALHVPWHGVDL